MKWFLKNLSSPDADTLAAANLLVTLTIVAFAACCLFIPIFYGLGGRDVFTFSAIVTPFVGSSIFVLRWTGSLSFAVHYFATVSCVYITGVLWLLGGANAPGAPAYNLLVLGITFMLGGRAGVTWTAIFIVTIVMLEIAARVWVPEVSVSVDRMSTLATIANVVILAMICFYALKSEHSKNDVVAQLRRANRRTAGMIAKLEMASERLLRSSEQFLGSKFRNEQGLVSKMMDKAHAGRHTIEEAKDSVVGMIQQYQEISERVQELHRHSEIIIGLVSTIDRISDRLDLMALTVGIEAAQSTENARQFITIAKDMRLLAERVVRETDRIKSSLRSVNDQVESVLQSSAAGQDLTAVSVQRMNEMVGTFDEIYALIEDTEGKTGQITADTLAQIEAVRRVVTAAERDAKKF